MSQRDRIEAFTVRVYGLLIKDDQILLSRENIYGGEYLKFPGGGLEFGEGTIDCLRREFKEECDLDIEVGEHFYTTENYVPSAFSSKVQVLSIYYFVSCKDLSPLLKLSSKKQLSNHGDQELVWRNILGIKAQELDLPIDQLVMASLKDIWE